MTQSTSLYYQNEAIKKLPQWSCKLDKDILNELFEYLTQSHLKEIFNKAINEDITNVKIQSFKEGTLLDINDSNFFNLFKNEGIEVDLNGLGKLNTAIRITNIQKINKSVLKVCKKLIEEYQVPVTCNMYISPNQKQTGLGVHSDEQITFALQVLGKKKWKIYLENEKKELIRDMLLISPEDLKLETKDFIIEENEVLHIPFNSVHKVECIDDTPSLHLAFALNMSSNVQVYRHIFKVISEEFEKNYDPHAPLEETNLKGLFENFSKIANDLELESLENRYKNDLFNRVLAVLKSGRNYD